MYWFTTYKNKSYRSFLGMFIVVYFLIFIAQFIFVYLEHYLLFADGHKISDWLPQ